MLRIYDYGSFFLETLSGSSCPSSDPSPSHSLHVFITVVRLSAATCMEVKGLISSKSSYLCCHLWLQIHCSGKMCQWLHSALSLHMYLSSWSHPSDYWCFFHLYKKYFSPCFILDILSVVLPSKFTNPFFPAPSYLPLTKCVFHLRHCAFIWRSLS